jgi:hypothetical protein
MTTAYSTATTETDESDRPRCQAFGCCDFIPRRAYQDEKSVRACCAKCAGILFKTENPGYRLRDVELS